MTGHSHEMFPGWFRFPPMPQDGFRQITGPSIVQEFSMAMDCFSETDTPEWRCSPFLPCRKELGAIIRQFFAHVMK